MHALVMFVAIAGGLLLAGGYLGALHPLGDSLAVVRYPVIVVVTLAVIWTPWPRRIRWPLALVGLVLLAQHVWLGSRPDAVNDAALVVYQKNLLWSAGLDTALGQDIQALRADVVTLQEVSTANQPMLGALRAGFPTQTLCPFGVGGVAVLSRWPRVPGSDRCGAGAAAMQVVAPSGPVWVVSIHLRWPWPYGQARQVADLVPFLETLQGPVVIGGDFNTVAWSHALRRIERASGTKRLGRRMATYTLNWHGQRLGLHLGIDHVLASGPGAAETARRPRFRSDHHGVLARISDHET